MRLFIAIELPQNVRQHLIGVRDELKHHIRKASFTRDENLHVTLKFLGETDPRRLEELNESLAQIRVGGPIEIFADRIECFPDRGPVRIIAAGFGGDLKSLAAVHRSIEQRCERLGFDRETCEYRPHVTLVRARPTLPASMRASTADATAASFPLPTFAVREFALFKSQLGSEGSRYEVIARFSITAA